MRVVRAFARLVEYIYNYMYITLMFANIVAFSSFMVKYIEVPTITVSLYLIPANQMKYESPFGQQHGE